MLGPQDDGVDEHVDGHAITSFRQGLHAWLVPFKEIDIKRVLECSANRVFVCRYLGENLAAKELRYIDAEHLNSILSEAVLWSHLTSLRHPNLLPFRGVTLGPRQSIFLLSPIRKESLSKRLDRDPLIPDEDKLAWAQQAARGLAFLHEQQVLHLDMKDANVLLTKDDVAQVADFGTSRIEQSLRRTMTGTAFGTPNYLAPEALNCQGLLASLHSARMQGGGIDANISLRTATTSESLPDNSSVVTAAGTEQWQAQRKAGQAIDVYAFGITLHRLAYQEELYPDFRDDVTPVALFVQVREGLRPPCRGHILDPVMQQCWDQDVAVRPTLRYLLRQLALLKDRLQSGRTARVSSDGAVLAASAPSAGALLLGARRPGARVSWADGKTGDSDSEASAGSAPMPTNNSSI